MVIHRKRQEVLKEGAVLQVKLTLCVFCAYLWLFVFVALHTIRCGGIRKRANFRPFC